MENDWLIANEFIGKEMIIWFLTIMQHNGRCVCMESNLTPNYRSITYTDLQNSCTKSYHTRKETSIKMGKF